MGVADARTTEPETESLSRKRRRFTVAEYHPMIETDLPIVREADEASALRHPTTALLVRTRVVEVRCDPDPKAGAYRSRTTLAASETLIPLAFPGLAVPVESRFD